MLVGEITKPTDLTWLNVPVFTTSRNFTLCNPTNYVLIKAKAWPSLPNIST